MLENLLKHGTTTPTDESTASTSNPFINSYIQIPPFNFQDASLQYNASALAYCLTTTSALADFSENSFPDGLTVTDLLSSKPYDIHGYVGYYPNGDIQVAYRGSKTAANFALDFEVQLITLFMGRTKTSVNTCVGCEVHSGFYKGMESVLPQTVAAVKKAIAASGNTGSDPLLLVTGHSLGGALAALTAYELVNKPEITSLVETIHVTTFGEPRVGNAAFASHFDMALPNAWRVVNAGDTVPHTPISEFGYYHEGIEVWMKEAGTKEYSICTTEEESDSGCSNSLVGGATLLTPWSPLNMLTTKLSATDHNQHWPFGKNINACPI
jgi:hypothetical protein